MKKKTGLVALLTSALLVLCCGCAAPENDMLQLDVSKLKEGQYTFATRQVNGDVASDYDTVYTVSKYTDESGRERIRIESHGEKGAESIDSVNVLLGQKENGRTEMSPVSVSMDYKNNDNTQQNVSVNVDHLFNQGKIEIHVKQYPKNSNEMTASDYTVNVNSQYYDSETLPFVISCLSLYKDLKLNFTLSSSNRDSVQSMCLTVAEVTSIKDANDNEVECYAVVVRPNTAFTSTATYMYYSTADNSLIKIQQSSISFTFKSFAPPAIAD